MILDVLDWTRVFCNVPTMILFCDIALDIIINFIVLFPGGVRPVDPAQLHPATLRLQEPQAVHFPQRPVINSKSLTSVAVG